jgi:hypothetical protein
MEQETDEMKVLMNLALTFLIAGGAVIARAQNAFYEKGDQDQIFHNVSGFVSIDSAWTLKGVKEVLLYVEYLPPEVEQAGLTRAAIQTDVELKLRLAGLTVGDMEDAVTEGRGLDYSTTMLSVEVLVDTRLDAFWSAILNVSIWQFASLPLPAGTDIDSEYYFYDGRSDKRKAFRAAQKTLTSIYVMSGVRKAMNHRWRHTLASDVLARGGTLATVADILGISIRVAEKHYVKWTPQRQENVWKVMNATQDSHTESRGLLCPKCGSPMEELAGDYGPIYRCSKHSSCTDGTRAF